MTWIEIENDQVIGVHSHKGTSPCNWIQTEELVEPGDQFIKGKVVRSNQMETQLTRKQLAERHIQKHYSLQEQIRILRGKDKNQQQKLDDFLRQVDDWLSNDRSEAKVLKDIRRPQ